MNRRDRRGCTVSKIFILTTLLILPVLAFIVPAVRAEEQKIHETLEVDLVDLYLTATDSKGHAITNLKAEDLIVKEDGVSQQILRFGQFAGKGNEIPLFLSFVMDNSASMDDKIGDLRKLDLSRDVATLLLDQTGPLDHVMLVRFSDSPIYSPVTSDKESIVKSLNDMRVIWWHTALFDALASSINKLKEFSGRKVLLICSDGKDNMSETKFEKVLELATNTPELIVIVLGIGATNEVSGFHGSHKDIPNVPYLRGKEYLQDLAARTAGFAYFPESMKDVKEVLELMRYLIRSQYYLAYRSTNRARDGSFRRIEITSKRKGVSLHYRQGYYAERRGL